MKIKEYDLTVRHPTPYEKNWMDTDGVLGFYYNLTREVVVSGKGTKNERKFTLNHELGHALHGDPGISGKWLTMYSLSEELVADYHALNVDKTNEVVADHIRQLKWHAARNGMDPAMVELKEKVAMKRVGYRGRPVSWT